MAQPPDEEAWSAYERAQKSNGKFHPAEEPAAVSLDPSPVEDDEELQGSESPSVLLASNTTDQVLWSEPLDIFAASDLATAPILDANHLPEAIYKFSVDVSRRLGVDPATVALIALASCASMMTEDWKVQPKRRDYTWTENARIWAAIVGDPGILKTPVITVCTKPIDKIDAQARAQHKIEMREYRAALTLARAEKQPEPQHPKLVRYLVADATIDALSEVLRDDDEAKQRAPLGKVLSRHDEMTEWLGGLDRYKAGGKGGSDRGAYLRLHNGGRHVIDRIGRGSFAIQSWSACFVGGIQPAPFARIARETSDDGLLQRFLWAVPDAGKVGEDLAPDRDVMTRYEALFPALLNLSPGRSIGGGDARPLVLDEGAQQHREDLDLQLRALASMPDIDPRTKSALDKWGAVFARLCLTFHLIEIADARARGKQPPVIDVIKAPIAAKVAAYMQHILLPHLLRAHAVMLNSEQSGHATWIAGYILTHKLEAIAVRDIVQSYKALRAPETRRELQSVMESLTQIGWCEPVPSTNPAKGITSWRVNPMVHTRFAEQTAWEQAVRAARKAEIADAVAIRTAKKAGPE